MITLSGININCANDIHIINDTFSDIRLTNSSGETYYVSLVYTNPGSLVSVNNQPSDSNRYTVLLNDSSFDYIIESSQTGTFDSFLVITNDPNNPVISVSESVGTVTYNPAATIDIDSNLYNILSVVPNGETQYYDEVNTYHLYVIPIKQVVSNPIYNEYVQNISNEYDELASKFLIRTNPKLTGNIKLIVDSDNELYFDTFSVDDNTSNIKYKKKKIDPSSILQSDIKRVFGDLPAASMYKVKDHVDNEITENVEDQYNMFYSAGVNPDKSNLYKETKRYFAPLLLRKKLPEYFVVFGINGSTTEYDNISDFLKNARIVKTFSLKQDSNIGKYIRNYRSNSMYTESPLVTNFNKYETSTWIGINYQNGIISRSSEYLYDYLLKETDQFTIDKHITSGFERHHLIYPNILNLEFLFDDNEAQHEIVSYFGFYVDENIIGKVAIDYKELGITTDNVYTIDNVTVNRDYFYIDKTIDEISGKIPVLKGKNDYFLKIKNAVDNKITIPNKRFDISNLYSYEKSIKQFKVKPVTEKHNPYVVLNFSDVEFDRDYNFEIVIQRNDATYNFYATDLISEGQHYSYLSYDRELNTYYGAFSFIGARDTIITALYNMLNDIPEFVSKKLTNDRIAIIIDDPDNRYNGTEIEVLYNFDTKVTDTFVGGGDMSSQFLVHNDDISYISETFEFQTTQGWSSLMIFQQFFVDYINDSSYKLLTLKNGNIKIDDENYVYASNPIDPQLAILSVFPISDFDFLSKSENLVYENQVLNELKQLESEYVQPLIDNVTLRPLSYYKYSNYVLSKPYYYEETTAVAFEIDYFVDENIKIADTAVSATSYLKINWFTEEYTFDVSSLDTETGFYVIPLTSFNVSSLESMIQSTGVIDNTELNVIISDYVEIIELAQRTPEETILLWTVTPSLILDTNVYLTEETTVEVSGPSVYEYDETTGSIVNVNPPFYFENLTLKYNNLDVVISNKNQLSTFTKEYNATNLITPVVNKWAYSGSTSITDSPYTLDKTVSTFGFGPDILSSQKSMTGNSLQWFDIVNIHPNYIDSDYVPNRYSLVVKNGSKQYTVFNGIKYSIESSLNLVDYKFAIVLSRRYDASTSIQNEILVNHNTKIIIVSLSISLNSSIFDSFALMYSLLYNVKHDFNPGYYINTDIQDPYKTINIPSEMGEYQSYLINQTENTVSIKFNDFNLTQSSNKDIAYTISDKVTLLNYFTLLNEIGQQNSNLLTYNITGNTVYNVTNAIGYILPSDTIHPIIPDYYAENVEIKSYVCNGGNRFIENLVNKFSPKTGFSNNYVSIKLEEPTNIGDFYRYDGIFQASVYDISEFKETSTIRVDGVNQTFSGLNVEFLNIPQVRELHFNKITSKTLNSYTDYHEHNSFKSPLAVDYYTRYIDNKTSENFGSRKVTKNFFNSPVFNVNRSYRIIPNINDIRFDLFEAEDIVNMSVELNMKSIVRRMFVNKIDVDFIDSNIYPILTVDSIELFYQNDATNTSSSIDQNINTINITESPELSNSSDTIKFSVNIPKKDIRKYKIILNINHR